MVGPRKDTDRMPQPEDSAPPAAAQAQRSPRSLVRGAASGGQRAPGPVLLVGFPNVGKSSLFNLLTGSYVTVSNYPGTTVGVTKGRLVFDAGGRRFEVEVRDPPGMYSLSPLTDEERVARDTLLEARPSCVLHVVDAKNLPRSLGLTLRLLQTGLPLILVCNMIDEARAQGYRIDTGELARRLGIPVIATCGTDGEGCRELIDAIRSRLEGAGPALGEGRPLSFDPPVEAVLDALERRIEENRGRGRSFLPPGMDSRTAAILALEGDRTVAAASGLDQGTIEEFARAARDAVGHPFPLYAPLAIKARVDQLLAGAFVPPAARKHGFAERLSRLLISPWTGLPVLAVVLYGLFYQFVGVFGAGTVVGLLEEGLFGRYVNPFLERTIGGLGLPPALEKLFVGDYGVFTLGITYAVALVLPIVFFFFLAFSVLEDSGYFPRLALLVDRLFKRIGLNGRAVIPMALGFGCDTMATITTRTLETKRERILATLLLALAIPCSAQLGIIMALLGSRGFGVWAGYVLVLTAVVLFVGWLGARLLPGRAATFHMELPPLRFPRPGNVFKKSFARMRWYFLEVVPLFLAASVILWVLDQTGGLALLHAALTPIMGLLGLPQSAADSFLVGFFRRDFGAAGLFKLAKESPGAAGLSTHQLFVASVTLTLFVPCIAQFMTMFKERGPKVALLTFVTITIVAVATGTSLHHLLSFTGLL